MDTAKYLGYSDWRLPASDTCADYNCTRSEMGKLIYNGLGQVAGHNIGVTHNANYSLFKNVQSYSYWSGTEYAQHTYRAWYFNTVIGYQFALSKSYTMFALAVRHGNIAAVPEPGEFALILAGLGLMGWMARRKILHRRT